MTSSDREKLTKLAWKLLEAKYWYYRKSTPKLTDYQYDLLEKQYEQLCITLNIPNTVSNMVDFDEDRPCCRSIIYKFEGKKAFRIKKVRKQIKT